ncbi:MAG: L-fucose mutarotase [Alphaproteobacteria bacterium MarineAlpha5_Bin12]|nr:ribose ABC transporter [Pelagibacteraceae bacterium]PPR41924.1 MAG: L-fucose mutarotase [Alphaproteobacteria bacterium MarineAlpha5_Bin12]|tara:strand:- start:1950 stop:2396 length:447 start_codon:yes stop_codon:yes gene_type:complete
MLININPILSPDLLSTLHSMGHGDTIVLADANFPSSSLSKKLIRLDGVDIPSAAKAILSVFPLDSFIEYPVRRMEIDNKPEEINDIQHDFIEAVKSTAGERWKISSMERFKFYEETKKAYAVISTTDARAYGCFMLTKGVIKPDGSVW